MQLAVADVDEGGNGAAQNPRKLYPADPGLIKAFDASGRFNVGRALETAVLNELERRRAEVGYVKTPDGLEVDFLERILVGGAELIQVCADVSVAGTLARELRALTAAAQQHSRAVRRLLGCGWPGQKRPLTSKPTIAAGSRSSS